MRRPRGLTKSRVLRCIDANPNASSAEVAEMLQLSRAYVRATASRGGRSFRVKGVPGTAPGSPRHGGPPARETQDK